MAQMFDADACSPITNAHIRRADEWELPSEFNSASDREEKKKGMIKSTNWNINRQVTCKYAVLQNLKVRRSVVQT